MGWGGLWNESFKKRVQFFDFRRWMGEGWGPRVFSKRIQLFKLFGSGRGRIEGRALCARELRFSSLGGGLGMAGERSILKKWALRLW